MKVLIAGGGFAGVEAMLALGEFAGDRVQIELVSADDTLTYRPNVVKEPFGLGEVERIPLAGLCERVGATLRRARVLSVDAPGHRVETDELGALDYDVLLLAPGARREAAVPAAITFDGTRGVVELRRLLDRAVAGEVGRIAFVVPGGITWPLPIYELALLTYEHLREHGASVRLDVVTPEAAPLGVFGAAASDRVRRALAARGIGLHGPEALRRLGADAVVALPRIAGPRIGGLPSTPEGFIPVDEYGVVNGTADVYAAGDVTDSEIKQGGLATQQAEVAAGHIAARAGAPIEPRPFAPALRALLLTGAVPLHLREDAAATARPLWPAGTKVLGTRLARVLGAGEPGDRPEGVELALTLADEEAAKGHPSAALGWLDAAQAVAGRVTPEIEERRRRWTLTPAVTPPARH